MIKIKSGLDLLETYLFFNSCLDAEDCCNEPTFLAATNQTISYGSYSNRSLNGLDNLLVSYFRRSLNFLLYRFESNTFQTCGSIMLNGSNKTFDLTANMFKSYHYILKNETKKPGMQKSRTL